MKLLFRLATLPLLLISASCSTDAPVDPAAVPQYTFEAGKLEQLAQYQLGIPQVTVGLAQKSIGLQGGTISLAGFEVEVPPGAVSVPTLFTIRIPLDSYSAKFVRADFGPHQEFEVPVTIRLPLNGTTAENHTRARVLWWNGTDWVPFPTTLTADGRIETTTMHFSEYGTEADSTNGKGVILGNRPCGRSCGK
jgi:hypothetical protein